MKIRVWDLPTRLFHWALVVCVIGSIVTINLGGNWVQWHFRFGYAIWVLLLFRITWGFAGPRYARFGHFPPSLSATWAYLRGQGPVSLGHNPLGAWSVYALLAALTFQVTTGLFANDAILWEGPLRHWVSNDTSDWLTRLHKWNRFVIIGLVVLHILAIIYYSFVKKQSLVGPMWHGDKTIDANKEDDAARDNAQVRWGALTILAIYAAAVTLFIRLVTA